MATSTVILFYCVSILKILPALLINLDCTRCDVTLNSVAKSTKGVVPRGSVGKNKKSSAKTSAKTTKKEFCGIRWFPCVNALGDMGPTITHCSRRQDGSGNDLGT